MNEKPIIVPIQLGAAHIEPSEVVSAPAVACELELNGASVTFYNGIDKHILHAVLGELGRHAR
ncbi:MAG: hypothetical protein ACRC1D_07340 [Culicoidibacterales bacterium]